MKEITKNLFLGGESERPTSDKEYVIISCAHETYVKQLEENKQFINKKGYFLKNSRQVYFDFEDESSENKINIFLVKKAVTFIANNINFNKIYVHCLFGANRSPSITFIYCVANGVIKGSFKESFKIFKKIYPNFTPNYGWLHFLKNNFPYKGFIINFKQENN